MKLAISGKGGVGKTTLAALLALSYARDGHKVLAVDADPDANLGSALGFAAGVLEAVVPIAQRDALIEERTGARPGVLGQVFTLNPRVDDLPERFWIEREGVRLLVMGTVARGGAGCACPENALLSRLIRHLVVERGEVVIIDMEAGLEHLGRGTARGVDAFLVVVEPGQRSLQTAHAVVRLARDLGVERVMVVANKVRPGDHERLARALEGFDVLGSLPYDPAAIEADLAGRGVGGVGSLVAAAEEVRRGLEHRLRTGEGEGV
jgi:CO dehydrogenase maturation factor